MKTHLRLLAAALLLVVSAAPLAAQSSQPDPARALFERAMRYRGAETARGVYAYWTREVRRFRDSKGEHVVTCDELVALPDREQMDCESEGQKVAIVVTSASAFVTASGQTQDMPQAWVTNFLAGERQTIFALARAWHDGKLTVTVAGADQVNGLNTQMLDVSNGIETVRWWVDPTSGRVPRKRGTTVDDKGVSTTYTSEYSDFRTVGGIVMAFHADAEQGGEHQTDETQAMELNPPVDPRLFYRPPPLLLDQVAFNPAPAPPAPLIVNGALSVISQPTGAQLYVDDVAKGTTSESEGRLIVEDLAPGSHRLRVGAAGYREWTKTVSVEPGDRVEVTATLERAGPPPFTENDVTAMLGGGISPKRAAVLVQERGVDFALNDAAEQRLRQAGADDALLLAIAKAKK